MQFLRPDVMRPQREKILSMNPYDAGADRRSSASGPMSLYMVICLNRPELSSIISVPVCLGQVR